MSECLIDKQLKEKNGNSHSFSVRDLQECFIPKKRTPVILIGGEYAVPKGFATRVINIMCNEIKLGSCLLDMEEIYKQAKSRKKRGANE